MIDRAQQLTLIAAALINTSLYQQSSDSRALIQDAATIVDLINDNQDDWERKVVTEEDFEMIAEIERSKNITSSTSLETRRTNNSFIQEDDEFDIPF